jgi:hypothetical protein
MGFGTIGLRNRGFVAEFMPETAAKNKARAIWARAIGILGVLNYQPMRDARCP